LKRQLADKILDLPALEARYSIYLFFFQGQLFWYNFKIHFFKMLRPSLFPAKAAMRRAGEKEANELLSLAAFTSSTRAARAEV
jgi:hypothetical protein